MSLDIYLDVSEVYFTTNITHNLNTMADKAGLYYVMWRPEEIGVSLAEEAIPFLRAGIKLLESNETEFKEKYSPENGWGTFDGLLKAAKEYLKACEEKPHATIRVSR